MSRDVIYENNSVDAGSDLDQACLLLFRYLDKAESGLSNLFLEQKHNGLMAALLLFYATPNVTNPDQFDGGSELSSVQIVNDQFALLADVIRKSEYSHLLPDDLEKFVSTYFMEYQISMISYGKLVTYIVGCRGASQLGGSLIGIPPGYKANKL